jgi:aminopeptidase N
MGHEWWGAMVGANSNDHPFMVEGLTNALTLSAINATLGPDAAARLLDSQIANVYKNALEDHGDGIVDTSIRLRNPKGPSQIALVYGKGALGFLAIRIAMGDDAFYAAIKDYANAYLYENAEPQDLLAIFEKHAPDGVDVDAIWTTWFERAVTTADDVDALVADLNQRFYEEADSTS